MDFQVMLRNGVRTLDRNSPTILTAIGVAGLVTTVAYAIKGTINAVDILHQEAEFRLEDWEKKTGKDRSIYPDEIFTTQEIVELTWKQYIPMAGMGIVTMACMIGSNHISLRRNAALVSLLSLAESAAREYQAKVVEKLGEKKEEQIRGEINQDTVNKNPPPEKQSILVVNKGQNLCFDKLSGRYFFGDMVTISRIVNEFNHRLLSEMQITLNELYSDLGLPPIDMGAQTGWDIEKGMVDIFFSANLSPDGQSAIVLEHRRLPTNLWG